METFVYENALGTWIDPSPPANGSVILALAFDQIEKEFGSNALIAAKIALKLRASRGGLGAAVGRTGDKRHGTTGQ